MNQKHLSSTVGTQPAKKAHPAFVLYLLMSGAVSVTLPLFLPRTHAQGVEQSVLSVVISTDLKIQASQWSVSVIR